MVGRHIDWLATSEGGGTLGELSLKLDMYVEILRVIEVHTAQEWISLELGNRI